MYATGMACTVITSVTQKYAWTHRAAPALDSPRPDLQNGRVHHYRTGASATSQHSRNGAPVTRIAR